MIRDATISPCGSYRYDLTRQAGLDCPCVRCATLFDKPVAHLNADFVLWVCANPSLTDAKIDDATERRGWGFTSAWGYTKMVFVNVNPYRSTDPKQTRIPGQLIIDHNEGFLIRHALEASLIICTWGTIAHKELADRVQHHLSTVAPEKLHTLGLTKGGVPKHPLYLPKGSKPQLWKF